MPDLFDSQGPSPRKIPFYVYWLNLLKFPLADTLDAANGKFLEFDRSPGRKLGTIDNLSSHFYLALYWAQALAAQTNDSKLAAIFKPIAEQLTANEAKIVSELLAVQGKPVDLGGYYQPDPTKAGTALRP